MIKSWLKSSSYLLDISHIPLHDLSVKSKVSKHPKADVLNVWSPTHSAVNNLQQVEPNGRNSGHREPTSRELLLRIRPSLFCLLPYCQLPMSSSMDFSNIWALCCHRPQTIGPSKHGLKPQETIELLFSNVDYWHTLSQKLSARLRVAFRRLLW